MTPNAVAAAASATRKTTITRNKATQKPIVKTTHTAQQSTAETSTTEQSNMSLAFALNIRLMCIESVGSFWECGIIQRVVYLSGIKCIWQQLGLKVGIPLGSIVNWSVQTHCFYSLHCLCFVCVVGGQFSALVRIVFTVAVDLGHGQDMEIDFGST